MVVLPFDLFPSLPEDPVGVGSECGVEGVVGRWVWGDSAPIDNGEAIETGDMSLTSSMLHTKGLRQ